MPDLELKIDQKTIETIDRRLSSLQRRRDRIDEHIQELAQKRDSVAAVLSEKLKDH